MGLLEQVFELFGGEDKLSDGLRQFLDDARYASDHFAELKAQYPDQFVCIYDKTVICNGKNLRSVVSTLNTMDGIDAGRVYLRHTAENEHRILVLSHGTYRVLPPNPNLAIRGL